MNVPNRYKLFCKSLIISVFLFLTVHSNPSYAYGGYGHHGYGYHHGYGHGARVGVHHHSHNNTLGYIVLGLLGLYVLHEIFDDDDRYDRYPAPRRVETPPYRPAPRSTQYNVIKHSSSNINDYQYNDNAGWDALIDGHNQTAMTVFAIQSQQQLTSGIPKVGFALAAASNGELERAAWSMHKAVKHDPFALNQVKQQANLDKLVTNLKQQYQLAAATQRQTEHYHFMLASLSYLQSDLVAMKTHLGRSGESQSTRNLAKLSISNSVER